jgi:hypothetical protein
MASTVARGYNGRLFDSVAEMPVGEGMAGLVMGSCVLMQGDQFLIPGFGTVVM